jgi:cellulose synthase A
VAGDEEEEGVDDLEGEFGLDDDPRYIAEAMLRGQMTYGRGGDSQFQPIPDVPLLTNGQMVRASSSSSRVGLLIS